MTSSAEAEEEKGPTSVKSFKSPAKKEMGERLMRQFEDRKLP